MYKTLCSNIVLKDGKSIVYVALKEIFFVSKQLRLFLRLVSSYSVIGDRVIWQIKYPINLKS